MHCSKGMIFKKRVLVPNRKLRGGELVSLRSNWILLKKKKKQENKKTYIFTYRKRKNKYLLLGCKKIIRVPFISGARY